MTFGLPDLLFLLTGPATCATIEVGPKTWDDELMDENLHAKIVKYFDENPTCAEAYNRFQIFHVTHSSRSGRILSEGLKSSSTVIPAEALDFLEEMFHKYGTRHPDDRQFFDHYIQGKGYDNSEQESRGVFLSAHKPFLLLNESGKAMGYVIPERVIFLLRNLNDLATFNRISSEDSQAARKLFERISEPFLSYESSTSVFSIDPTSEEVLETIFQNFQFDESSKKLTVKNLLGLESEEDYFQWFLGQINDIIVSEGISPESLTHVGDHPIDVDALARQCTTQGRLFYQNQPKQIL